MAWPSTIFQNVEHQSVLWTFTIAIEFLQWRKNESDPPQWVATEFR